MRIRAALVSVALLLGGAVAVAPAAYASSTLYTYTALGTDSSDWNDPGNWSPSGVPGDGDSVYLAPPSQDHCSADIENAPDVALANLTVSMDGPCEGNTYLRGGSLTVSHQFTWHGGEISTPLDLLAGSTGTISPGTRQSTATDYLTTTIDVHGSLALSNDQATDSVDKSLLFGNAGRDSHGKLINGITVEPGATLSSSGTNDIEALACCNNPTRVVNDGTIDVADGSLLRFDNAVLDQDGTLQTDGSSAELDNFAGDLDEPNTASNATYTGPGTYRLSIGQAALAASGTLNIGDGFHFVLGGQGTSNVAPDGDESLSGTFALNGGGEFDWLGGAISGHATINTAETTIGTTGTPGSGGNEGTPGETTFVDATSTNAPSTVTVASPVSFAPGADANTPAETEINDHSVLNLNGASSVPTNVEFVGDGSLANHGTFTVQAGTSSVWVTGGAALANAGTVHVVSGTLESDNTYRQTAGSTTLASGGHLRIVGSSSQLTLAGGQLDGTGVVYGNVANTAGSVSPAAKATGTLTIQGNYTQQKSAKEYSDVSTASHDVLAVHGAAVIHGALHVRNHYTPKASDKWTSVTATSRPVLGLSCTTTTGRGTTGKRARHWVASVSGKAVILKSAAGRHATC